MWHGGGEDPSRIQEPTSKLVRFFHDSRDNWKSKHANDMVEIKRLKNRIRYLEDSKAEWKQRALDLQAQLKGARSGIDRASKANAGRARNSAAARGIQ